MAADRDAFTIISEAWRDGRPVVPLFGAGISAGAAIPLTPAMVDYLAKVQWHFSGGGKTNLREPRDTAAEILTKGWPEPQELNADILREWEGNAEILRAWNARDKQPGNGRLDHIRESRYVLPAIVRRVLHELGLHNNPHGWLVLLQQLCDNKQELKDLFFARLEHGRRPATAHQLAAFLAGLLGWQLILTTNFDTLLEQALRSQSLDPTIYELPEQGKAPDPQLVRSHFSVVKLHGGAFGRLMSETLNYSLPTEDRSHLLGYFPKNPLVLVLGYGGGDARVMSLIRDLVDNQNGQPYLQEKKTFPRVLWIHRTKKPPLVESIQAGLGDRGGRLVTHQYRNGGRFLQELYCRLASSHPVSATYYRAFPHMGPSRPKAAKVKGAPPSAPVVVFHAARAGHGTSTALAEAVEGLPHEVIWCDLETIATVDGLMTYLQNRFRRFDAGLPSFAFFQADGHSLSALRDEKDPRVRYLLRAMQRGKYVVAIDSLAEFGTSFREYADCLPSGSEEPSLIAQEAERLQVLLKALIERHNEFGESRLFIAHTYLATGEARTDAKARYAGRAFLGWLAKIQGRARAIVRVKKIPLAAKPMESSNAQDFATTEGCRRRWQAESARKKGALALAACFRRRRDLVVLRRLLFNVVCPHVRKHYEGLRQLFDQVGDYSLSGWETGIGHMDRDEIDIFLADLEPLLIRQEGGFYWMHNINRSWIYRRARKFVGPAIANAHDLIAAYYYTDLFRPSNDPAALLEYIFQRLLSIRWSNKSGERIHRLHDLAVVLKRERDHLLRDTDVGSLRRCIGWCREVALANDADPAREVDLTRAQAELRQVLCELEAEACRQASLFGECIKIRSRQIQHRLQDVLAECGVRNPEKETQQLADDLNDGKHLAVLGALTQKVLPTLSAGPGAAVEALRLVLRLFDHLIEVAASWCALGDGNRACALLLPVRAVCRFALGEGGPKEDNDLLKSLGLGGERQGGLPPLIRSVRGAFKTCPRELACQIQDVRVRCAFRLMEVYLRPISPWARDPGSEASLRKAISEFAEGQRVLQEYTGWQDRQYDHYVCFLNTLRARAAYLPHTKEGGRKQLIQMRGASAANTPKGEFALAYLFLDAARAAIRRPVKGSDFSALAIILLHRAECLILHADDELDKKSAGDAEKASAKAKLDRARTALHQAHTFLERGRLHVWAWTWLRVLEAQLQHELIVWYLGDKAAYEQARRECDEALRKGIRAICIGFGSCRPCGQQGKMLKDLQREKELKILWWQLFFCFAMRPGHPATSAGAPASSTVPPAATNDAATTLRDEWKKLNHEAGLESIWRENQKMAESLISDPFKDLPSLDRKSILAFEDRLLKMPGMPLFCKELDPAIVDRRADGGPSTLPEAAGSAARAGDRVN